MKFIVALFLAIIATTLAGPCDFVCSTTIAPVCGSDGKTYFNACTLRQAACKLNRVIKVARNGVCPTPTECLATTCVDPLDVCVAQPKQCITTPCPQVTCMPPSEAACNRVVCPGTRQCTYTPRKCAPNTICPQFSCVRPSTLPTKPPCAQFCPQVYQPVCGSDGKTYSNSCFLSKAACEDPSKNLRQISAGACPCDEATCAANEICVNEPKECVTTPCPQYSCKRNCPEMCIQIYQPICGSDGKTYSNSCFLSKAACEDPTKNLQQVSEGACPCDEAVCAANEVCVNEPKQCITTPCPQYTCKRNCPNMCAQIYQPVCGSDGKTYSNYCVFNKAVCEDTTNSLTILTNTACPCDEATCASGQICVNEPKECVTTPCPQYSCKSPCPEMCIQVYQPVCGSDGVTYSNSCFLSKAACENPTKNLQQVSEGPCSGSTSI